MSASESVNPAISQGMPAVAWPEMVARIRSGDESGMEQLYRVFAQGIRFQLWRRLEAQDLDDILHDIFLAIAQSIRAGEVREPERLMGYVRTVVRRQVAEYIESVVRTRSKQTGLDSGPQVRDRALDPERRLMEQENVELARRVLNAVPQRDREVLIRFYLQEQTAHEICRAMDLTENQFRLIKSRAKARFGELGRNRLASRRCHGRVSF